jgi:hypothetical protein
MKIRTFEPKTNNSWKPRETCKHWSLPVFTGFYRVTVILDFVGSFFWGVLAGVVTEWLQFSGLS